MQDTARRITAAIYEDGSGGLEPFFNLVVSERKLGGASACGRARVRDSMFSESGIISKPASNPLPIPKPIHKKASVKHYLSKKSTSIHDQ
jgi:hypothetical protein